MVLLSLTFCTKCNGLSTNGTVYQGILRVPIFFLMRNSDWLWHYLIKFMIFFWHLIDIPQYIKLFLICSFKLPVLLVLYVLLLQYQLDSTTQTWICSHTGSNFQNIILWYSMNLNCFIISSITITTISSNFSATYSFKVPQISIK